MERKYSKAEKELVEAVVGLFILLPNPELKGRKKEVMKIAFEVLDNMLENAPDELLEKAENDELDDDYMEGVIEKIFDEIKEKIK